MGVLFGEVSFKIFQTKDGKLIFEGSQTSDEIGNVWYMNEAREIDIVCSIFISGRDETTGQEASLEMANLKIIKVDLEEDSIIGQANPKETVLVYAYDVQTEEEFILEVVTNSEGEWEARFDIDLHMDMELFARIFDQERDQTSVRWQKESTE
jgi:hypothetical protein